MTYPNVIQPQTRKPFVPVGQANWATAPVPLIGLDGVTHQWGDMMKQPLFGTFIDKPLWVLVPDNWRDVYPAWQVEALMRQYVTPTYITQMRLVEVNSEAFKELCLEKDRKKMKWHLGYYGKDPNTRKRMLDYWVQKWGIPYE
jgi:hypothetical protein